MYYIASSVRISYHVLSQHAIERNDGCYIQVSTSRVLWTHYLDTQSRWVARLQVEESRRESVLNVFLSCYGFISAAKHQH
jgi:hypothetical protein